MNERLNAKLIEMKEALSNDKRFLLLDELNKELEKSEEVKNLSIKKDEASDRYQEALKINNNVEETKKMLYQAKLELDGHPLVKEYNEAFITCRDLLMKIDDILFNEFRSKKGDCGC